MGRPLNYRIPPEERPKGEPFQAWTITLPDGSGFDLWIHNLHEPAEGLRRLLELAEVEGYGTIAKEVPKP